MRIAYAATQHLVSAADAYYTDTFYICSLDAPVQSRLSQAEKVLNCILSPRDYNHITIFYVGRIVGEDHLCVGLVHQGIEVSEIGDVLEPHDHDADVFAG